MTTVVNHSEGSRERELVRRVIWVSIWLLLIVGSPWRIQAGEAAPVTDDNVAERIAQAKTSADHEAIAEYYKAQAAVAAAKVKEHEAMLASYKNVAGTSLEIMRNHCKGLIQSYGQEQREYEALAKEHEKLAQAAGGHKQ